MTAITLLVRMLSSNPDLRPVARSEISFPKSVTVKAYVVVVAPLILAPFRNHW